MRYLLFMLATIALLATSGCILVPWGGGRGGDRGHSGGGGHDEHSSGGDHDDHGGHPGDPDHGDSH